MALPARIINCIVSTVLYRHAGAAPSYLEALLLSASCHGAAPAPRTLPTAAPRCLFTRAGTVLHLVPYWLRAGPFN